MTALLLARRVCPALTTLAVALWLGSLVHTLLSVATLFRVFPKAVSNVAVEGAPALFAATERFHLILAVVAIGAVMGWRRLACNRARRWLSYAIVAGTLFAVVQAAVISPKMERLRAAGEGSGPAFRSLHGVSSTQYLAQTACLLAATLLLPASLRETRGDSPDAIA